jgi:hypothetical protein
LANQDKYMVRIRSHIPVPAHRTLKIALKH